MDLGKILEKKELEVRDSDNSRMEDYIEEHPDEYIEFKGYEIPREEYNALEEIAAKTGKDIEDYEIGGLRDKIFVYEELSVKIRDNHITRLRVNKCNLRRLPESIGDLTRLRKLELYSNQLTRLPNTIGNLANLRGLALSSNRLTRLPRTIGKLRQLDSLWLAHNKLRTLPKKIGKLPQLQHISIKQNKLSRRSCRLVESLEKRGVYVWT